MAVSLERMDEMIVAIKTGAKIKLKDSEKDTFASLKAEIESIENNGGQVAIPLE